jgi:hypothetical protein
VRSVELITGTTSEASARKAAPPANVVIARRSSPSALVYEAYAAANTTISRHRTQQMRTSRGSDHATRLADMSGSVRKQPAIL